MLEKTLENPLDSKEIQPVYTKGNQSWIFIGRNDAKAETPVLWPLDAKNWLTGKDPDAGKDRRWEKGTTEDEMVGWHHRLNARVWVNSWSILKLMYTESVMPSNHLILCHPLLLPSIMPSIRVFSNESVLHIRWPKYWNFSFSISPSNEYSGLISSTVDWLDLLGVQGTLQSLVQYHSSKALILQCSAFFTV